jgi:hypothetical protein
MGLQSQHPGLADALEALARFRKSIPAAEP